MALTKCNVPTDVVGSLGTTPAERPITTQQFKDKFDEMPEGIKNYLNNTLTVELDTLLPVEGTWTPTINATSVLGTPTYVLQNGNYYKMGKLVVANMQLRISNKGGMSGNLYIGGLPFQPAASYAVNIPSYYGVTLLSGKILSAYTIGNAIELRYVDDTSGSNLKDTDITDDFAIWVATFVYVEQ